MVSESGQRAEAETSADALPVASSAHSEPSEVEPLATDPAQIEVENESEGEPTAEPEADVRPAPSSAKPPQSKQTPDSLDKPPKVIPNTYWMRKGGGWVLEYKRKVKHRWQYEYFGLLELETWEQLKGRYEQEKLTNIIRGVILARRAERQRLERAHPANHRLRLVGKG